MESFATEAEADKPQEQATKCVVQALKDLKLKTDGCPHACWFAKDCDPDQDISDDDCSSVTGCSPCAQLLPVQSNPALDPPPCPPISKDGKKDNKNDCDKCTSTNKACLIEMELNLIPAPDPQGPQCFDVEHNMPPAATSPAPSKAPCSVFEEDSSTDGATSKSSTDSSCKSTDSGHP